MAMLSPADKKSNLTDTLFKTKSQEKEEFETVSPLLNIDSQTSSEKFLEKQKETSKWLKEMADSGELFNTSPPPKEYPIVPENRFLIRLASLKCYRYTFLLYFFSVAVLLYMSFSVQDFYFTLTEVYIGSLIVLFLIVLLVLSNCALTEVFCPCCGHGTLAYRFPLVRSCTHCGTRTCHVKGKPTFCIYCGYPMIPSKPKNTYNTVYQDDVLEKCSFARCVRCGKESMIRMDVTGGGH